ncbi:Protein of unknown function [Cognatiyoonia koreensis]|uniref:DUF3047 domain-containing protein n=1 Tax=Cognatiyoonia koreensis TaxID=364200 RepID=A0A1I0Q9K0_9RHOB|nr:DUF3047 domain-containing protein [Cognatiyoonia koreensis]SEW23706.1 Protein of unknown function [Cognatiyoonia koreensis]
MRLVTTAAVLAAVLAHPAIAGPVSFASGWAEQRLSLFSSNDYSFGNQLSMVSNGSVSIAWTRLPRSEWAATGAAWTWAVEQSVPATSLAQKGGDDRNIALYFVFLPESAAEGLEGAGIRQLLGRSDVRTLIYTWGGNHGQGQFIQSPYLPGQGVTVALRQAGTGSHSENVNLARDYTNAFGGQPGALVGLAVSGDSDDTSSVIRAAISGLRLQ